MGTRCSLRAVLAAALLLTGCLALPAPASADSNVIRVEFFATFDQSLKATDYDYSTVAYYVTSHTHIDFDESVDLVAPPGLPAGAQIDSYAYPLWYDVTGTQFYTVTPTSDTPRDQASQCYIYYFGKSGVGGFTATQPPPVQIVLQNTAHGLVLTARAYPPFAYAWPQIITIKSTASGLYILPGPSTCVYQGHYTYAPNLADLPLTQNLLGNPDYLFYLHPVFSAPFSGASFGPGVTHYNRTIKFSNAATYNSQTSGQPHYSITSGTIAAAGSFGVFDELLGSNYEQAKRDALLDLPAALNNAVSYCTPHAIGLGGFGVGLLLLGAPGAAGGALVVAGSLTAAATQPFCIAVLKRVLSDWNTFNDPPAGGIGSVAKPAPIKPVSLPSCSRWHSGPQRSFCSRLSPAEARWARAAELVASIDKAIEITVSRETTAGLAHKKKYVDLQDKQLPGLERMLRHALGAQTAAGRALATVLKAHRLGYRMSQAQSASVIAAVEAYLSRHGLASAKLQGQDAADLTPRPIDVLKALG